MTVWTYLRDEDFVTTVTPTGGVPIRTSEPDEIALWRLAHRLLLVDTEAGVVCNEHGQRDERPDENAYGKVYLGYVAGKARWASAHRVVWLARHGQIPGNYRIVHLNRVHFDNRIANLTIATHADAMRHAHRQLDLTPTSPVLRPHTTSADRVYPERERRRITV